MGVVGKEPIKEFSRWVWCGRKQVRDLRFGVLMSVVGSHEKERSGGIWDEKREE